MKFIEFKIQSKLDFVENLFYGKARIFSFLNPFSSLRAPNNSSIIYGIDSYYLAKWLGIVNISFDNSFLAQQFFAFCQENKKKLLIIGGTKEESIKFQALLTKNYPSINIHCENGYKSRSLYQRIVLEKGPDFVLLGLGTPLQEEVGILISETDSKSKIITCGGYISQSSRTDRLDYFPRYISKLKLHFLYRFLMEKHVLKRTIVTYPKFFKLFLSGKIKFRKV